MRSLLAAMTRGLAGAVALTFAMSGWAAVSLKDWRDGPVASLLTAEEYREFGRLATDEQRREFIEGFWRGVEAGLGAAPGAYRELFQQRCTTIDDRFRTSGVAGWRTDQGRVFLALGEPSAVQHEAGSVSALEREVWSYGGSTGGTTVTEPKLSIVFYKCRDGSYRLDGSCAVERNPESVAYDAERAEYFRTLRRENPTLGVGTGATLNGFLLPVPGGITLPSPTTARSVGRRDLPVASSAGGDVAPGVHALENATYFFRAQDGSVLTLLTVELLADRDSRGGGGAEGAEGTDSSAFVGAASVEETGRRGENLPYTSARDVALDLVPRGDAGGTPAFFGRVYLQPGRTYAVRYAVKDGTRDQVFVRNDLVGVPELSHGFSVSSIVPAAEYGPAVAGDGRFQIGSEEVVPKAGGLFRRSELLRLYLQVYDAALGPETSLPKVDVVFRFYRLINGATKRAGKPFSVRGATGASMGLALPIGDWPTGPYRVVVQLHDRVSDARATAEGFFGIVDE